MPLRSAIPLLWICVALVACSTTPNATVDGARPTIIDVRTARPVTQAELVDALVTARFRLLGERHDNPTHHAIRAGLIRAIVERGSRPAVVLETFDLEHDVALRAAQRELVDAERLADAGRLDRKAWQWPLHRPIVDVALSAGLPIRAGNLSRGRLRELLAQDTSEAARFPSVQWTAVQQAVLVDDIVEGHCRKLPADAVRRLVLAQRMRDDAMAQALVDAANDDGAILVAGNGHVRKDLGVMPYVRSRLPDARIVVVGLVEVDRGEGPRAADIAADHAQFDYVVLTDRVVRPDPCASIPAGIGR